MLSHMQLECYVTNPDLNVVELLNFGIRFFDFDLKYYSEKDDMWTGHGPKDLFFTTARFEEVLEDIQQWMIKHLHELVIVYVVDRQLTFSVFTFCQATSVHLTFFTTDPMDY